MSNLSLDEEAIISSINRYLIETLEEAHASFGNAPPCPFVHAERSQKKIRYRICAIKPGESDSEIEGIIRDFAKSLEHTSLLIIDPTSTLSKDEGIAYGIFLSNKVRDIKMFAACIHPNDSFQVGDMKTREPIPHTSILVQSVELLKRGRLILGKSRYYEKWSDENFEYVDLQVGDI
jgi:hypothetical protein